ncbi:carbamate kinase [Carnobacterium sp. ISL-102]|uniref:carbamate kinase n=1 Tax=Carnobacterium sp. ISL-102 TaxID=2819142 RepID=UPI001BE6FE0D|nr:carbamate kinase [Carnobacterium sp. ISL-102]MBT2733036.1 carbamate kinase [Carnobacterium sp. ISL-102]
MMGKRIIVALGGNAILSTDASAQAQEKALADTAEKLAVLVEQGNELIISHGNGPQVGNLLLQQAATDSNENPAMPLDTCVAMTQGSIGYWMQKALRHALKERGITKEVATILTEVVVDENDPAFKNPTKPIGPFLTEDEAKKTASKAVYKEDAGRGWRKVVPSPKPININETAIVKLLVEQGIITISTGGGGVPVIEKNGRLEGVEAVIDKDFASEKLAELIDADLFIILTGVDNVYINFNKPDQKMLEKVTTSKLKQYIEEGQFAPGSMLPKVEAAIMFAEQSKKHGETIITSLENLTNVIENNGGTRVVKG